ncbi:ABC transporter substrate-binding protein [Cohnella herbarum]|uniref:ABC transporter substrate-binding protein n=1 Tax=Cohnella herbarum TaxID=2728023 RepID=A0A7Z2VGZ1_9BACL|nr:ABC transporter substrate-binding protein [Cohnella herbarum]QJD82993.1 ABC transporter substrate-binding protein [Cohnella herbarum]
MKKWVVLTALCMFVSLLSACGSNGNNNEKQPASSPAASSASSASSDPSASPEQSDEPVSLAMGMQPWVGNGPWWIADKAGIFKKHGLDVTIKMFNQDADMNAAYAADVIQVSNVATHTAIKLATKEGVPMTGVIFLDESHKADAVLGLTGIDSITQLKGKKIAFEEGTTSDLLIRKALKENNISLDDVKFVQMPASDAGMALLAKKVDAAVTYEPYISTIMNKGDASILYSGENAPGLISDIAIVRTDFLEEHAGLKEKLMKAWDESLAYWKANQAEGNEIVAKESGISAEELPVILDGLKYFSTEDQNKLLDSGELLKSVQNIQQILIEQGALDKEVDLQKIVPTK